MSHEERPSDIRTRTFRCEGCDAIMLRATADWRETGPHCPICQEQLAAENPAEPESTTS